MSFNIEKYNNYAVVGFDGGNYTGKSTFIKYVKEYFERNGDNVVVEIIKPTISVEKMHKLGLFRPFKEIIRNEGVPKVIEIGKEYALELANAKRRIHSVLFEDEVRRYRSEEKKFYLFLLDRTYLATLAYSYAYYLLTNDPIVICTQDELLFSSLNSILTSYDIINCDLLFRLRNTYRSKLSLKENNREKAYSGIVYESDEFLNGIESAFDVSILSYPNTSYLNMDCIDIQTDSSDFESNLVNIVTDITMYLEKNKPEFELKTKVILVNETEDSEVEEEQNSENENTEEIRPESQNEDHSEENSVTETTDYKFIKSVGVIKPKNEANNDFVDISVLSIENKGIMPIRSGILGLFIINLQDNVKFEDIKHKIKVFGSYNGKKFKLQRNENFDNENSAVYSIKYNGLGAHNVSIKIGEGEESDAFDFVFEYVPVNTSKGVENAEN